MLQYETARKLYEEMNEKAAMKFPGSSGDFYKLFLKIAVDYANTRTTWASMNKEERIEDDYARRLKHDAFISILSAVSRNLSIDNIEEVLPDRKTKGDFACYIALFLGLEQR